MSGTKIKRGDTVVVIRGDSKVKNQRGKVLQVLTDESRVIVEGVNKVYKHLRRSQEHPKGGRIEREAAMALAKVALVCPLCGKATRVGFKITTEGTKTTKKRQCKKCQGTF